MNFKQILFHVPRVIVVIILLQTLYFKFTGLETSMYIFSTMGMEPWGRIAIGVVELFAGVLLFFKPVAWLEKDKVLNALSLPKE